MRHAEQLPLTAPWIAHDHAVDLATISQILDALPTLAKMVHADLVRKVTHPTRGAPGLNGDQVLRIAITQRLTGEDYRELAFRLADSTSYRTFCRLSPLVPPPVFQTLQTNLAQIQPETWAAIHRGVIEAALAHQIDTGERVRIDTTPVPTMIHPPSDSTLLTDGVRVLSRLCKQARHQIGFRDFHVRTRAAKRRMVAIQYTKPRETTARTQLYRELLALTHSTLDEAEVALVQCLSLQAALDANVSPRVDRLVQDLTRMTALVAQVIAQTERRVLRNEVVPATEKVVSLFEPHTDVIVKDNRETIFGHKLVLTEGASRLIVDYEILDGNPSDTTLALPPLERLATHYHLIPTAVAYDGGFPSAENMAAIQAHGVRDVCFTKARGLAVEDMASDAHTYRALRRFRAGIESAISRLKRVFGLACCVWKGQTGFLRYVHTSVLTANLLTLAHHLRA